MSTIPLAGRAALSALVVLAAAGCAEPGPPAAPPEGWTAEGDRWWVPGTDTSAAFRDLSTVEAMGVARDESEFVRWAQEKMTDLYRTNPEVVDSVFGADVLPVLQAGVPSGGDYGAEADALVNQVKTDFFQRYNSSRPAPRTDPLVVPDSLAGVSGRVVVQVYLTPEKEPVAVELVEGTGTTLDEIVMRRAIGNEFTDAWVRERPGQSAGVNVPNWVRVENTFGG